MKGTVARIYLPPDANCLLSVADHCLRSRDYVNLIVIDKQPQLQYLDLETAAPTVRRAPPSGSRRATRARPSPTS
jgi:xylulose-5-phosphate/fructose-6-phosphate phosphoketolase